MLWWPTPAVLRARKLVVGLCIALVPALAFAQVFVYPRRPDKSHVRYFRFEWRHVDIMVGRANEGTAQPPPHRGGTQRGPQRLGALGDPQTAPPPSVSEPLASRHYAAHEGPTGTVTPQSVDTAADAGLPSLASHGGT